MKTRALLIVTLTVMSMPASLSAQTDQAVHVFILSGQSNMQGMNPEAGFVPEAKKLFPDATVVYLKVAQGGQPIRHWVAQWDEIAEKHNLDVAGIRKSEKSGARYYQPILDQYAALVKQHGTPTSVTLCWMQGERDAKGGTAAAYKDSLNQLIANLRDDLKRPDMFFVIGRLSDHPGKPQQDWQAVRRVQVQVAQEDNRGAWVDTDDLNDKEVRGQLTNDLHYTKEGYATFGRRLARQAAALIQGNKPANDGRPQ